MSVEDPYGDLAYHLIRQSKLSLNLGKLLPYNGPLVRSMIQEQKDLERSIVEVLREDGVLPGDERWPKTIILARVIAQNKQCLLVYHSQRLDTIQTVYWAATHITEELRDKMSTTEIDYLRHYRKSVAKFCDQVAPDDVFGLAMGIEDPPGPSLFITMETVVPPGPVHIESGLMDFELGTRYIVWKPHVEHLILQSYLREVK
ncbi:GINS complex Psf1 component [Mycena olivaceomarginata]|nr:GINS complex Psf1 component [Mycena olivaceomarginata]